MVGTRLRAKFCHRTKRGLGGDRPRQNKQTDKYLVDCRACASVELQIFSHLLLIYSC